MCLPLTISVTGTPAPWGGQEWTWRGAIAEAAHQQANLPPGLKHVPVGQNDMFMVDIVFSLCGGRARRLDLDNLAKPVLDTLFLSRNAQAEDETLTGALFDVDDDRVFRLVVEKKSVHREAEEGAVITIHRMDG